MLSACARSGWCVQGSFFVGANMRNTFLEKRGEDLEVADEAGNRDFVQGWHCEDWGVWKLRVENNLRYAEVHQLESLRGLAAAYITTKRSISELWNVSKELQANGSICNLVILGARTMRARRLSPLVRVVLSLGGTTVQCCLVRSSVGVNLYSTYTQHRLP